MSFQINYYLKGLLLLSMVIFFGYHSFSQVREKTNSYFASVFFVNSIETKDIVQKYQEAVIEPNSIVKKVKIMIVPGHDDRYSGAQIGAVREADLTLKFGTELAERLSKTDGVEVLLARDKSGYHPLLQGYFKDEEIVKAFRASKVETMKQLVSDGKVRSYINIQHNTARPEVSLALYGINKFANDFKYDIVLHIHFNDYPGRVGVDGKYSGFSIYVPESQYSNAEASHDLARKIMDQLVLVSAESDLPNEEAITEDQELIAIGAFNTLDSAVGLIEYGYIYESQFTEPGVNEVVQTELVDQTYRGIIAYISDSQESKNHTFAVLDRFTWTRDLEPGHRGVDVLALQNHLHDLGYYPLEATLNTCPLNGKFATCTQKALVQYQRDRGINTTGLFGPITQQSFTDLNEVVLRANTTNLQSAGR